MAMLCGYNSCIMDQLVTQISVCRRSRLPHRLWHFATWPSIVHYMGLKQASDASWPIRCYVMLFTRTDKFNMSICLLRHTHKINKDKFTVWRLFPYRRILLETDPAQTRGLLIMQAFYRIDWTENAHNVMLKKNLSSVFLPEGNISDGLVNHLPRD